MLFVKLTVTGMALWFSATTQLAAQYHPSKYEIGLQAGTLIYQGDLASSRWGYGKDLKPAIGLSVTRHLDPYFSLRGNLTIGNLHADESKLRDPAYQPYRNLPFEHLLPNYRPCWSGICPATTRTGGSPITL